MLFFGPSRLPQLGQSLGKALRGFKEGLSEKEKEKENETNPAADANARIEAVPKTERDVSQQTDAASQKKS